MGDSMLLGGEWNQTGPPAIAASIAPGDADPDKVGRGVGAHFATLSTLVTLAAQQGLVPLDSRSFCPYDLAWQTTDTLVVVEVKSLTADNEDHQIRYGLGQVLDYRYRLRAAGHPSVQAALVLERQPGSSSVVSHVRRCWRHPGMVWAP